MSTLQLILIAGQGESRSWLPDMKLGACSQASKGRLGALQILLERGADTNTQDRTGSTALHRQAFFIFFSIDT